MLSEAMDIPTLAEAEGPKSGLQRQAGTAKTGPNDMLEPQAQGSRPVWAGPSWPIANSHGAGARSVLSGSSPFGKSIDMADAMQHFSDAGIPVHPDIHVGCIR